MSIANTLPKHLKPRREKVFGLARGFPHDRNARVRIQTYGFLYAKVRNAT
jgi:hypothetical protein